VESSKGRQVIIGMLADLIGPDSLIVIAVVVVVLLFGGTRLPKLARGLGSASHEFKKGMEEGDPSKDEDKTSGPITPS
jgi:sec-independent protein translocase protein TatA